MYHYLASSLLLLGQVAGTAEAATKHGIIGMGITMYKPVCAYACHDALSSLYLNCTTFAEASGDMDHMMLKKRHEEDMIMGTTSDECYANNTVWLQTLAYCMSDRCATDGVGEARIAKAYSTLSMSDRAYSDMLPAERPATELDADAKWLNVTSLVNPDLYLSNRQAMSEFEFQEGMHNRLSVSVITLSVGIALLAGLYQRYGHGTFLPVAISKHLVLPALFNGRHQTPLPGNLGYAPTRFMSLLIFLYVFLNFIFCAVPYKSVRPNAWYTTEKAEIATYVANRTGVLSFANLALAIMFTGRIGPLITLSGLSQTTCLQFHRWAARVATVQAIVHSILYTVTYFWSGGKDAYYDEVVKPYYWWGIIATIFLACGIAFSVLLIRKLQYEIFLVMHIIIAIIVLVGCWYHINLRFQYKWGYEVWLYIAFAFWAFERLARLALSTYRNMLGNTTQAVAELMPGGNFMKLTVYPGKGWNFGPGRHAFLFFPSTGRFWETHPFSIAAWSNGSSAASITSDVSHASEQGDAEKDTDMQISSAPVTEEASSSTSSLPKTQSYTGDTRPSITFLIRPHKGITSLVRRDLARTPSTPVHFPVSLEGPYGCAADLTRADAILCIGGGIGVTHILAHIQHFVETRRLSSDKFRASRLVFAWSYREKELAAIVKSLMPSDAQALGVELLWRCTGEGGGGEGRLDVASIVKEETEGARRLAVMVCAPGELADEVRRVVVECEGWSGTRIALHEQSFAW